MKQNIIQRIKAVFYDMAAVRAEGKDAAATTAAELQPENRLPLKMMQKTIWMLMMLMRMTNLRLSLYLEFGL